MSATNAGPVAGSCFCGAVRFEATPPTTFCAHCHCTMCRRSHGAGYVTWFGIEKKRLEIVKGAEQLVRHVSSDHGARSFCGVCGSALFCESTKHPDTIDVVLANMEGPIDRAPEMHVWFSDRVDWVATDDGLPRLGGASGLEPVDE